MFIRPTRVLAGGFVLLTAGSIFYRWQNAKPILQPVFAEEDALLPHVENGSVTLIGATTENPYFEVIKALISRSRVFQLRNLNQQETGVLIDRALTDKERGYGDKSIKLDPDAGAHLIDVASGDARNALNAIELAVESTPPDKKGDPHHPGRGPGIDPAQGSALRQGRRRSLRHDQRLHQVCARQ